MNEFLANALGAAAIALLGIGTFMGLVLTALILKTCWDEWRRERRRK